MANLGNIKQDIRQFGSGGISKTELEKIAQQNRTSAASVVKQIDIVNRNAPSFQTALNSGAANMLINQLSSAPRSIFTQSPTTALGTGQIGRTVSGMVGRPASDGGYINPISGYQTPISPAVAPQLMIGGTQIRPGGRVAINPTAFATPTATPQPMPTPTDTPTAPTDVMPELPKEEEVKISLPGVTADLANWATGFKTKKSSRKSAGSRAQGLASQRINPAGTFRGGI